MKQEFDKRDIIANIKSNIRNRSKQSDEHYYSGTYIFDEELYKHGYVTERANAWIDALKVLLLKFEHSLRN